MRRHLLAIGASALALAVVPTLAVGAEQGNVAGAEAGAANLATAAQSGGGTQTATNTQILPVAAAPAVAAQVVPVNLNLPVNIASSGGGGGSVDQSNVAAADAQAANQATISQKAGGEGGSQTATNTQVVPVAAAPAVAAQVVPVNANVPVNVLSDTPAQEVTQSNRAYAGGAANNTAAIHQEAPKAHKGKDAGTTTQTATNTQILPVAAAPAVAAQVVPVNANVPVNLFTTGTPAEDGTGEAGVSQANNAYAGATAANTTAADQRGTGTQTATNTQVLPISLAPALSPQLVPVNANIPVTVGNPLAVLPLPVDPLALLGDPVGTLTGLAGSLPLGAVTGLAGSLPLGAVTGLAGSLPLGAVTGLVGNPLGTVTGLAGSLPLGAVTGLVGSLPLGAVTGLLPVGLPI